MKPERQRGSRSAPLTSAAPSACAPSKTVPLHLPAVAICSPALTAVSGVSTHANMLLGSVLERQFRLMHFQVGSEGRSEAAITRAVRTCLTPLTLATFLLRERPAILHLNTSMALRPFCRDAVLAAVARLLRIRVISQIHGGRLPQEMGLPNSRVAVPPPSETGAIYLSWYRQAHRSVLQYRLRPIRVLRPSPTSTLGSNPAAVRT